MSRVILPDSESRIMLFGSEVKEEDGVKFVVVGEPYDDILVKHFGGQIAEDPAPAAGGAK